MTTLIGYEIMLDNGDGSVQSKKFKTKESAQDYLDIEEASHNQVLCDAGPNSVYLEDFKDSKYESP